MEYTNPAGVTEKMFFRECLWRAGRAGSCPVYTVVTQDNETVQLPQTGIVPENASPEALLALLRSRFLYHEKETIENDLCYVIR